MELVLIWVAFGIVTAIAASARGRSGLGWFFLGVLFSFFALIVVLVLPKVETAAPPVGRDSSRPPATRTTQTSYTPLLHDTDGPVSIRAPGYFDVELRDADQYQPALQDLIGSLAAGQTQWRGRAILQHQGQATGPAVKIAVLIEGAVVGHLPHDRAARYAIDMIEQRAKGRDATVAAKTYTTQTGTIGVKVDIGKSARIET